MLDIEKYEFLVLGIKYLILAGIYVQNGIDWNQFPAGKRIDYD
jgi:hypothetical protein